MPYRNLDSFTDQASEQEETWSARLGILLFSKIRPSNTLRFGRSIAVPKTRSWSVLSTWRLSGSLLTPTTSPLNSKLGTLTSRTMSFVHSSAAWKTLQVKQLSGEAPYEGCTNYQAAVLTFISSWSSWPLDLCDLWVMSISAFRAKGMGACLQIVWSSSPFSYKASAVGQIILRKWKLHYEIEVMLWRLWGHCLEECSIWPLPRVV